MSVGGIFLKRNGRSKKNGNGNGYKKSNHHVFPSSRTNGKEENPIITTLPHTFHDAWHCVYGNLLPLECVLFAIMVNKIMEQGGEIYSSQLEELRTQIKEGLFMDELKKIRLASNGVLLLKESREKEEQK